MKVSHSKTFWQSMNIVVVGSTLVAITLLMPGVPGRAQSPKNQQVQSKFMSSMPGKIKTRLIDGEHSAAVELTDGKIYFNQDPPISKAEKLVFNPDQTHVENWDWQKSIDYLGRDFRPSYVPEDLAEHIPSTYVTVVLNKDGRVVYDCFFATYRQRASDLSLLSRSLKIETSKGKLPTTCTLSRLEAPEKSLIGKTDVLTGYNKIGYNFDAESNPQSYYDRYSGEFVYNGVGYRVTSDNLTEREFIEVLLSIIKL